MTKRNWMAVMALVAITAPAIALAAEKKDQTPAKNQPPAKDPSRAGLYHVATGFNFPPVVDGFNRVSVNAFNSAATNISIGYASLIPGSQVAVTVYIMPAPEVEATSAAQAQSCNQQFDALDRRFTQTHPDARQLVRGDVRSPSAQYSGTGRQVIYDYDDMFYGQKQTLRSETNLFCYVGGNWLIAYRSTSPVKVDYAPKLATFMRLLAWPTPGAGKPVASVPPAPAAPPAPPAAVAAVPNRVLVRLKAGKDQAALAGIVVTGTPTELQRFEAAAKLRGVTATRMTESGKNESIASLLKPEIRLADATDLYRQTRDGKFGKLKVEVMLLPPNATGDERDLLSRAAIVPHTAIETF